MMGELREAIANGALTAYAQKFAADQAQGARGDGDA
jgi:hypothetical protein